LRIDIKKAKQLLGLAKIANNRRAETLNLKEWGKIYGAFIKFTGEI
jgi:hypothetical protein